MRKVPFLRICLMLIFGIIINPYWPGQIASKFGIVIFLAIVLGCCKVLVEKWLYAIPVFGYAILLFSFSLGLLSAEMNSLQFDSGHFSNFIDYDHNYFEAEVIEVAGSTAYAQLTVEVRGVKTGRKQIHADGLLKLTTPIQGIEEGQTIRFLANVKPIESTENPFAFNYALFQSRNEIYHHAFVNEIEVGTVKLNNLQKWRKSILDHINQLPLSEESKVLMQAMLLGEKSKLKSMSGIFRATGTSHVLAISGLHVGIVATLLHFLLMWIPARMFWLKSLLVITGVWFFCLLSGMAPSTLRASIMVSSFMVGRAINIQGLSYNFCFLSGFFMLIYNPSWIYDVGFQFSFLAIIGILFFYELLYNALILRGIAEKIWQMIVLSISAQLTIMPLSLYYFHEFPLLFIPASVIAIPATFLMISASVFGLLLHFLFDIAFVFELLDWFNHFFLQLLTLLANREGMVLTKLFPTAIEIGLYFVCLIGISTFYLNRKKRYLTAFVLGFIALLGSQFYLNSIHNQKHLICYADKKDIIIDIVQSGVLVGFVEKGTKQKKLPYIRDPMRNKLAVVQSSDYVININEDQELLIGDYSLGILNTSKAHFKSDTLDLLLINRKLQPNEKIPNARQIVDYESNSDLGSSQNILRKQALVINF